MSEKIDPDFERGVSNIADDDPLAELARIVAGQPEPARPAEQQPVDTDVQAEVALAETWSSPAQPEMDDDLGQALEDALGAELSLAGEPEMSDVPASRMPAAAEDISLAVSDVAQAAPASPETESFFEDDLINALRGELSPEQPAAPVEAGAPDMAMAASPIEPAAVEPDFSAFEDALAAELTQEPFELRGAQDIESRAMELGVVDEPDMSSVAAEPAPEVAETAPADSLEGLADAFNKEFEDILAAEQNLVAVEPQSAAEPQLVEDFEVPEQRVDGFDKGGFDGFDVEPDPAEQPLYTDDEAALTVTDASAQSFDDLDFGSAFAEELGVEKVDEFQGWSSTRPEDADVEFASAAGGNDFGTPQGDYDLDPGHMDNVGALHADDDFHGSSEPASATGSKKYAIAALVIALFAGSIIAGYGFLGGSDGSAGAGAPQVIKADSEPVKVKPDDPGGKVVANQDKASYERVAGDGNEQLDQETLISNTEEPARIEAPQVATETNLEDKSDERLAPTSEAENAAVGADNGAIAPRVVQTVTVKPDGTIVQGAPVLPGISQTLQQGVQQGQESLRQTQNRLAETIATTQKPVETQIIKKPEPIDGAVASGTPGVPEASPLPKPVVAAPAPVVAAPAPAPAPAPVQTAAVQPEPAAPANVQRSEWVVQVSSQRTADAAQASYQNLSNRFSVIQGRPMSIQRANVNGDTFYRVRLQTTSQSDANQLCESLKASGGSCFVTR